MMDWNGRRETRDETVGRIPCVQALMTDRAYAARETRFRAKLASGGAAAVVDDDDDDGGQRAAADDSSHAMRRGFSLRLVGQHSSRNDFHERTNGRDEHSRMIMRETVRESNGAWKKSLCGGFRRREVQVMLCLWAEEFCRRRHQRIDDADDSVTQHSHAVAEMGIMAACKSTVCAQLISGMDRTG